MKSSFARLTAAPYKYICFLNRLFGTKCEKCCRSFGKTDFVMRAKNKIFHLDCFRCVACEKQLIPGDEFALRREGLFCKEDHQVEIHPGGGGPGSNTVSPIPPDSNRQSSIPVDMKTNANITKDSLENNNNNTILGLQGGGTAGQQMQLMHNTSNSSEDNSEGRKYICIARILYHLTTIIYNYMC